MILRKTYRLFEEKERELVYEEVQNEKGQITSYTDFQGDEPSRGIKEYNDQNKLIKEAEFIGGIEVSRIEYSYNSEGKTVSLKQFVSGELIAENLYEYSGQKTIQRSFQNGIEQTKIIESQEDDRYTKEYFDGDELWELLVKTYNPVTRSAAIEIRGGDNRLIETGNQKFDDKKNLVKSEQRNRNGKLLELSEFKYRKGKVILEKYENHDEDEYHDMHYDYDVNLNMISEEKRTPSGKLLGYQKKSYDNQNRLIWENGFYYGSSNTVYRAHTYGENYTFEHEYHDQ